MALQIVNVATGKELKLVKTNGFFRLQDGKVYVADLFAGEEKGSELLIINKEVAITDLSTEESVTH